MRALEFIRNYSQCGASNSIKSKLYSDSHKDFFDSLWFLDTAGYLRALVKKGMRAVIQRVARASVSVGGEMVSSIEQGLCVLVGIQREDTAEDVAYIGMLTPLTL